jgi:signal transduction histidine kinase/ActR/RegA family two-component response regulator
MAEAFFADEEKIFLTGQPLLNKENTWPLPSGEQIVSLISKIPLRDSQTNAIIGLIGFNHDITESRRAENEHEKLETQLRQAQKMEAVGRLAGGVAHDFNNILQIVLGNVELVLDQLEPANPFRHDLEEVLTAGRRAADLVRQLLGFARKQPIAPRTMNLNETVEGMLTMLRRTIGEEIEMVWTPFAGLWSIRMDPVQIDQILVNLCVNARDVIASVGTVHIATGNVHVDEFHAARHDGVSPGDYVLLTVSDTGCGMDKETQGKIFEPFFTTKEVGKGTGLGLATVYGIVQQNHGYIGVYSEPEMGATLHIYLPRYTGSNAAPAPEGPEGPPARGSGKLLLVEDDQILLRMCDQMLRSLGYSVLATSSPQSALCLAEEHAGEILLLVTDIVMPGMNGHELAARLKLRYPNLKCLLMSGFTSDIIARQGIMDGSNSFIQKPFSMVDLAAKVRATLSGHTQGPLETTPHMVG